MSDVPLVNCETVVVNENNTKTMHGNCCKRTAEDVSEHCKRLKVDKELEKNENDNDVVAALSKHENKCKSNRESDSLLVFSDDILLMILSHLDHRSIINLSKTCTRLHRICQDHTLWREINFEDNIVNQCEVNVMLKYVSTETKSICARGYYQSCEPENFFENLVTASVFSILEEKCPNLIGLELPNHYINCKVIDINQFPSSLTKLDLSNTSLINAPWNKSFFKELCTSIPNLESLILSNCAWFDPHSLMAISKCSKLKELRLYNCPKFKDCVAYCSLATRSGFKSLRTLDLRKCPVGSSELNCFASVPSIVNFYLECPTFDDSTVSVAIDTPIRILFTKEPIIDIRSDGNQKQVKNPKLKVEKLVVRNYKEMTDETLNHLARGALYLKYLDVTGTSVTAEGIECFKASRPNVTLLHDTILANDDAAIL